MYVLAVLKPELRNTQRVSSTHLLRALLLLFDPPTRALTSVLTHPPTRLSTMMGRWRGQTWMRWVESGRILTSIIGGGGRHGCDGCVDDVTVPDSPSLTGELAATIANQAFRLQE